MITAVDTSALLAIAKAEGDAEAWVSTLADCSAQGELIVGDVVVAELAAFFMDAGRLQAFLSSLSLRFDAADIAAPLLAGRMFRRYRDAGGPREQLIPDFLIAAHALTQAEQLAGRDRGYLRAYFPKLKLVRPAGLAKE